MKSLVALTRFEQRVPVSKLEEEPTAQRQTCLCCSNVLLRHVTSGKISWRCSHCGLNMPA